MPADFLGLIRFGVDDDCPCSATSESVVVRAIKRHQGWNGFHSSDGTFGAYLVATPSGDLFSGEGVRTIARGTGASSGTPLSLNPGGDAVTGTTYQSGSFELTDPDPPYGTTSGGITLSSLYTLGQIQADVDDILADASAHPAGMADGSYNLARVAETETDTAGSYPDSSGLTRTYLAAYRFPGESGHETWWGDTTVDGSIDIAAGETDPFADTYSTDADRTEEGDHNAYKIVTGWKKGSWYYRERAFVPATGYYSAQTIVTVEDGLGGEDLVSESAITYFYHSGAYVDVRSPHLDAGYEDEGEYGTGLDTFRVVKVYLWIRRSHTPPGGTPYTESSTAGQSEGC